MVGARGLGIAMLVLAAAVATPTLSAAQDPAALPPEQQQPAVPVAPPAPTPAPPSTEPEQAPEKRPVAEKPTAEQEPQAPAPAPDQVQTRAASEATGGGARASASATVSVGDNFYSPASVSVAVGDSVTWRNDGAAPHSATAEDGSFDTGVFNPGQSRSETFTQAGTISYYCTVHGRAQSGTVRVLSASGGGGNQGAAPGSSAAAPTEAQAVAAPDAAGTSTSLPATGFAALGLAVVGFALLASGHLVRRLDGQRGPARRRFLTIY